jgi:hypothetical protein
VRFLRPECRHSALLYCIHATYLFVLHNKKVYKNFSPTKLKKIFAHVIFSSSHSVNSSDWKFNLFIRKNDLFGLFLQMNLFLLRINPASDWKKNQSLLFTQISIELAYSWPDWRLLANHARAILFTYFRLFYKYWSPFSNNERQTRHTWSLTGYLCQIERKYSSPSAIIFHRVRAYIFFTLAKSQQEYLSQSKKLW